MDSGTASTSGSVPLAASAFAAPWPMPPQIGQLAGEIPEPSERSHASQELKWHYFQYTKATY